MKSRVASSAVLLVRSWCKGRVGEGKAFHCNIAIAVFSPTVSVAVKIALRCCVVRLIGMVVAMFDAAIVLALSWVTTAVSLPMARPTAVTAYYLTSLLLTILTLAAAIIVTVIPAVAVATIGVVVRVAVVVVAVVVGVEVVGVVVLVAVIVTIPTTTRHIVC